MGSENVVRFIMMSSKLVRFGVLRKFKSPLANGGVWLADKWTMTREIEGVWSRYGSRNFRLVLEIMEWVSNKHITKTIVNKDCRHGRPKEMSFSNSTLMIIIRSEL